ncbi:MAG: hypothetical protein IBJ18_06630 [Phycisphaerales bacterium]|nr:hypothetical protein [Phycisphaerales bacterium]
MDIAQSRAFTITIGAVCALVGVSAAVCIAAAALQPKPLWFLMGFELVTLTAAVFGVLLSLGKFKGGPAIGLLCVSACFGVGALLGYVSVNGKLGTFGMKPWFFTREACALVMAIGSASVVLLRQPQPALRALIRGVAMFIPVVVVLAGTRALLNTTLWADASGPMKVAAVVVIFGVVLGFFAASVHYVLKAFAIGDAVGEAMMNGGQPASSDGSSSGAGSSTGSAAAHGA